MAGKLAISTLSDVRNTMMMSGLTPFPLSHWATLGGAMKRQAAMHQQVAGHKPAGPFKHYWGEGSRYVGNDKPFSLFWRLGFRLRCAIRRRGMGGRFWRTRMPD